MSPEYLWVGAQGRRFSSTKCSPLQTSGVTRIIHISDHRPIIPWPWMICCLGTPSDQELLLWMHFWVSGCRSWVYISSNTSRERVGEVLNKKMTVFCFLDLLLRYAARLLFCCSMWCWIKIGSRLLCIAFFSADGSVHRVHVGSKSHNVIVTVKSDEDACPWGRYSHKRDQYRRYGGGIRTL